MKNEILNIINHEIVPSKDDCLWRYAPEFAASKIEELFKQWHIAVVMQALPPETITKEAIKYDASFGLTYLSTRELQIKAFKDGASFALQSLSKAAVASEGEEKCVCGALMKDTNVATKMQQAKRLKRYTRIINNVRSSAGSISSQGWQLCITVCRLALLPHKYLIETLNLILWKMII